MAEAESRRTQILTRIDRAEYIVLGRTLEEIVVFLLIPMLGVSFLAIFGVFGLFEMLGLWVSILLIDGLIFWRVPRGANFVARAVELLKLIRTPNYIPKSDADTESPDRPIGEVRKADRDADLRPDGGTTTDSGVFDVLPYRDQQTTPELTGVKRLFPKKKVAITDDNRLVGYVRVTGRDSAISSDKNLVLKQFARALATNDDDFDILVTGEKFNPQDQISRLSERESDTDIANRPILQELTAGLKSHISEKFGEDGFIDRRFYVVAWVDLEEIGNEEVDQTGMFSSIDPDSTIGRIIGKDARRKTEEQTFSDAMTELNTQIKSVVAKATRVNDIEARAISEDEFATVIRRHLRRDATRTNTTVTVPDGNAVSTGVLDQEPTGEDTTN
ncbi:hypothetical protein RYH80_18725 [Halobaculum sp. MBLA0147]|uniref:hypothetical protein n=1 Tax=Halobaculum sp. MBLA0147 TaxID=3079934 RepID=UPI0035241244